MKHFLYAALCAAAAMTSCSHNQGWTVNGTLANASEGDKLALMAFNASSGAWYVIDSISIGGEGSFSYTAVTPTPYSDVYSVAYKGKNIFFPIDSAETVTIKADAKAFDKGFELSGTDLAEAMLRVDRLISQSAERNGVDGVRTDSLLKRELTQTAVDDSNGLIAYYIISKMVGGKPIFDVTDKRDLRTIGAVANNFLTNRPDDPRTAFLERLYIDNRPHTPGTGRSMEAEEIGFFDISLFDAKGRERKLSDLVSQGKVVILSFVNYGVDLTAPYNVHLNEAYTALKDQGVEVYQVSVGDNEMTWKDSAVNLPWVSVYNPSTTGEVLVNYNVREVPTTYIINRRGELAEKVTDIGRLQSAAAKYL